MSLGYTHAYLQAVMGRFPSEVVYSLPEYSNLDHDFWYNRRGVGATDYIPVGTVVQQ
jgi:hypothetical protein